jgi:tetratricopeptide (TPR) repeat protein
MNADATGTRVLTFAVRIQSQAALQQFSVASINYPSQAEQAEFVYVRVTHADGATQETNVAETIEQPAPVTQQAPFYSDLEVKQLPVKSLRVGDTLEWQARFTVDHPEVPGQVWGQDSFIQNSICLDETYELRVPSNLHLTAWTNPRFKDAFSESSEGATHLYRWHHTELKPTVGPAADAFRKAEETRRRTPDEELDLTKGELPSLAWTSFTDWAAVGAWYKSVAAGRTTPDPAIRAKVAELTAGKTTDLEKAQAVYNYVSAHIRYIGVAFGIGRYQPHAAAEILANQYGDCKDKHTLLASMLSVLNLRADPVLIGAGIRFNPAVPSPAAFNHLITHLTLSGPDSPGASDIWLDTTAEAAPWRALVQPIRDHDALLIPAASAAVIVHTPADLPYPSFSTSNVVGALDKDLTSDSTMTLTYRGDDEIAVRAVLRSVSPSNYGQFIQQLMAGMGFGGTTSDPSFEHIDDTSRPIQLSFHYHRVKEKDWGENRITATFQGIALPAFTDEHPAVVTIQLGAVRTETSTVEMKLPPGWHAELPQAVHAHAAFATCDVTYRVEHGAENETLFAERRLAILQSKVPVDDFKKYQSWYDESGASGYPYIQLIPPIKSISTATLPTPEAPTAPARAANVAPSDPKAADLVQKAFESVRAMDLDAARKSLDDARAINPTEPHLWVGYATIAEMLGKPNEVAEDTQHELSLHPDEVEFYLKLYALQLLTQDTKGALSTLRSWEKAAPNDPAPPSLITNRLVEDHKSSEAMRVAETAIHRLSKSEADLSRLKVAFAYAALDSKQVKIAAATVLPLLLLAKDEETKNDIAYILADSGEHIEEAFVLESSVIAASEDRTTSVNIADAEMPGLQRQSQIAAEWDTMGWILYKQHKLELAYSFLVAADSILGSTRVRTHLASVESMLPGLASPVNPVKGPQFDLGPSDGNFGTARYVLLIVNGKVVDLKPGTNASAMHGMEDRLKALDLHTLAPPGSNAHLLRNAAAICDDKQCHLSFVVFTGN